MTNPATSAASVPAEPPVNVVALQAELERLRNEKAAADAKAKALEDEKAEAARQAEITRICAAVRLSDRAKGFIDQRLTVDQARAAVIDALAARDEAAGETRNHVRIEPNGADEREKWMKGAEAAILVRSGKAEMVSRKTGERYDAGEFRGLGLLDLARESLEMAGVKTRGMDPRKLVAGAFTGRGALAAIKQGTTDFTVLLENVMNKSLQAAYGEVPNTWSAFCRTSTATDFRAQNRYRLGSFGTLDTVNELGEFKHKPIPDGEKSTITIGTKGNIITVSRQAIINDDLNFLMGQATDLGRAARYSVEVDVYALLKLNSGLGPTLSDSLTFFHATHANVGAAAAPSVDQFDALRVLMAQQKTPGGNRYIMNVPRIWVGPIGLGGAVRVINGSQYDTSVSNKFQVPNKVNGLFTTIIDTPELTGNRYYIFNDPNVMPAIEVAFLNGEQEPFIDSTEGWTVDGTEWKVRLDYGVAPMDYRAAATSAGA